MNLLISPEYQNQQRQMHESKKINYGTVAEKYGETVGQMIDLMEIETVLDYGAGHNLSLKKTLKPSRAFQYQAYDPGVPELAGEPTPAEFVVCIDVLEHIEPECLEDVLDHLESLTEKVLFCTVHTGPAGKTLPDGRNAHLIQRPYDWWLPHFTERFELQGFHSRGNGFELVLIANNYSRVRSLGEPSQKGNGSDQETVSTV
jgi:hypothetical protein